MLATAITLALLAPLAGGDDNGTFRHGQWSGERFRDASLRGINDEICCARWSGNLDITFERDADRLTVSVGSNTGPSCTETIGIPADKLLSPDRAERLIGTIHQAARWVGAKCLTPRMSPFSLDDLRATLRETDGLIHVR